MTIPSGVAMLVGLFALVGGAWIASPVAAAADEIGQGGGEITVRVTIDEFDPCAVRSHLCQGDLASTGAEIGLPLGVGIGLLGVGTFALVRRWLTTGGSTTFGS